MLMALVETLAVTQLKTGLCIVNKAEGELTDGPTSRIDLRNVMQSDANKSSKWGFVFP